MHFKLINIICSLSGVKLIIRSIPKFKYVQKDRSMGCWTQNCFQISRFWSRITKIPDSALCKKKLASNFETRLRDASIQQACTEKFSLEVKVEETHEVSL